MQSVYVETTIPSYLASRPSNQPGIAVDQQATREWWEQERLRYRLFTSAFTIDECSRGDASAAERRLSYLVEIPELSIPEDLNLLEEDIIRLFQLPPKAFRMHPIWLWQSSTGWITFSHGTALTWRTPSYRRSSSSIAVTTISTFRLSAHLKP